MYLEIGEKKLRGRRSQNERVTVVSLRHLDRAQHAKFYMRSFRRGVAYQTIGNVGARCEIDGKIRDFACAHPRHSDDGGCYGVRVVCFHPLLNGRPVSESRQPELVVLRACVLDPNQLRSSCPVIGSDVREVDHAHSVNAKGWLGPRGVRRRCRTHAHVSEFSVSRVSMSIHTTPNTREHVDSGC